MLVRLKRGDRLRGVEEDRSRYIDGVAVDGGESMALLPFGASPDGDELAIEVVPTLTAHEPSGALQIHIDDPGPGGWIHVEASHVPHEFDVTATLEDGVEGRGRLSLEEPGTIELPGASLRLTVDRVLPGCPREQVAVSFDLDRGGQRSFDYAQLSDIRVGDRVRIAHNQVYRD